MSIIVYVAKNPDVQDQCFRLFQEASELRKQATEVRQKILMECVSISDIGIGNDAKVVISDRELFERYNSELTAKEARITKILETFTKLDGVIKPALAAGYLGITDQPTPEGVKRLLSKLKEQQYAVKRSAESAEKQAIAQDIPLSRFTNPFAEDQKDILKRIEFMQDIKMKCDQILREL